MTETNEQSDEVTPEQEWRVINDWLALRVAHGVATISRRYAHLKQTSRTDEADALFLKLMPSLWKRSIKYLDHYDND